MDKNTKCVMEIAMTGFMKKIALVVQNAVKFFALIVVNLTSVEKTYKSTKT